MDKQRAISKIAKCLALSASANENEAASALRQAKALMDQYGVSDGDLLASEIKRASFHQKSRVNRIDYALAQTIALSFEIFFGESATFYRKKKVSSALTFIGEEKCVEAAQYAFEVLSKQIKKAAFTKYPRGSTSTKVRNMFILGYIEGLSHSIRKFSRSYKENKKIVEYLSANKLIVNEKKDKGLKVTDKEFKAFEGGMADGANNSLKAPIPKKDSFLSIAI